MKKILFIILILSCKISFSQVYQNYPQSGKFPRLRTDSVLSIPLGIDRLRNISGGKDTGQVRYNVTDSGVYVYTGSQWRNISGAATSLGIDSVRRVGVTDTIREFYGGALGFRRFAFIAPATSGGAGWGLTGNASSVTDFLGTTNNRTMRFRTNNVERMIIDSIGRVYIGTPTNQGYFFEVNGSSQFNTGSGGRFRLETVSGYINQFFSTGFFNLAASAPTAISGSQLHLGYNLNTGAISQTIVGSGLLPTTSAILDVVSTTKGFLFPRMTTAQKNAIASPVAGLVVYDLTLNKLCVYTTAWEIITSL